MRNATFLQWVAVGMAMVGVCFPQMVLGANPATEPAPLVTDVKLNSGVLIGQVLDAQGKPLAGVSHAQQYVGRPPLSALFADIAPHDRRSRNRAIAKAFFDCGYTQKAIGEHCGLRT